MAHGVRRGATDACYAQIVQGLPRPLHREKTRRRPLGFLGYNRILMAIVKKRLTSNVPGEFYVDSTCIDCDACRQLVPEVFEDDGYQSFVLAQPQGEEARRKALRALLACPTGSIGTAGRNGANGVIGDFPLRLEDEVYYCGFNSEKSYGGNRDRKSVV